MSIHEVLKASTQVHEIRWFPSYEPPDYLRDRDAADSPVR